MKHRTFILVDCANMFFRARYVVREGDLDARVGLALRIFLSSVRKCWRDFQGTHAVFCLEGRSWRKDFYLPYKMNRVAAAEEATEAQIIEDKAFAEGYDDLVRYLRDHTNCTVLRGPNLEADDSIAGWIQAHPHDHHVILSSDTDFYQLICDKVSQYNGISNRHITDRGVYDDQGQAVIDKKTLQHMKIKEPAYLLFEKCVRGDKSDNIFTACPGAREKNTKHKTGIIAAFEDRVRKGYDWNNFMQRRWQDHRGDEHVVQRDFERNRVLIDLAAQPPEVRAEIDRVVAEAQAGADGIAADVGFRFLQFCGRWELEELGDHSDDFTRIFSAGAGP